MKKVLISFLICLMSTCVMADEQKKVTLSSNHDNEMISLSYCNIFVNLKEVDDGVGEVSIEMENLSESKVLILFDRSYTEKQVKKFSPKMKFDKTFGGTKGKRITDPCSEQLSRVMQLRPSDKQSLPSVRVENESTKKVTLPVYIAKYKGSKTLILLEKQVIELDIEAELKPSAEYIQMNTECEQLIREITNTGICPNKSHRTSADKQKEDYQNRIDAMKGKIDEIISSHGWSSDDAGYRRFAELKSKLDGVEFVERDCGRHKAPVASGHRCSYCGLSLQQIYHRLDDLYKKIYSSSDRKAAKAKVMSQVNALYNCCTDTKCSKHAAQWRKGGDYKSKIVERYNRINSL